MEEIRRTTLYGERKGHYLEEAAARYLTENAEQRGIARQGYALRQVVDWFGRQIRLSRLNGETQQLYVQARLAQVSTGTVVRELGGGPAGSPSQGSQRLAGYQRRDLVLSGRLTCHPSR